MSINTSNDKNIPTDTEAYYETVASQEIYLEKREEELRAILTFDDSISITKQRLNIGRESRRA